MDNRSRASERSQAGVVPGWESETLIVELKNRLTSVRELRDSLAKLVGLLAHNKELMGALLLMDPAVSPDRITDEWAKLRSAIRPRVAERVHIVITRGGDFGEKPAGISPQDWCDLSDFLRARVGGREQLLTRLPRPDLQSEVLRVMIHQWILDRGPMTSKWLAETIGCNYRTVAAARRWVGSAIQRHSDGRVELGHFPRGPWLQLLANADASRATKRYQDRSGQPRSPESLLRRLTALERQDVAVGGTIGARRYFSDLDLIGAPQLDLSVHCPGSSVDLSFVHKLDPALDEVCGSLSPSNLTLHFVRRKEPLFERNEEGGLWADPVECLLDLHEARLEPQAEAFAAHLMAQRMSLGGHET